jgi:hypothetical protein
MFCPFGSKESQQKGFYKTATKQSLARENPRKAFNAIPEKNKN